MSFVKKKSISIILAVALLFYLTVPLFSLNSYAATGNLDKYISNVKVSQSGADISVKYTVKKSIPSGAHITITLKTPAGTSSIDVGNNTGTRTKTYKMKYASVRVGLSFSARNYSEGKTLNTYYYVKTGSSTHSVTKSEETANKIMITCVSTAITIAGTISAHTITFAVLGIVYGTASTFGYNPQKGDYIVISTSFNKSTHKETISTKVYKSKTAYTNGKSPVYSNTYTRDLTLK